MTRNAINTSSPIDLASGGTATNAFSTANGVCYYDGSKVAVTGAGTAGQCLTSNGPSAPPSMQTSSRRAGTGAWTLIRTATLSAASAVTFSSLTSDYNLYMLNWSNISKSSTGNPVYMQFSTNGTTWVSTGYKSGYWNTANFTSTTFVNYNNATLAVVMRGTGSEAGTAFLTGIGWSTTPMMFVDNVNTATTTTGYAWSTGISTLTTAAVYTAIKLYPSSGTISGQISLYGLAK